MVPGFFATRPRMQGALTYLTMLSATLESAGAKSSSQIDSRLPVSPKSLTSSLIRTAGSPKLPSAAWQECAISGHGHDTAPHDESMTVGVCQWTAYGARGPVIAATTT